LAVAVGVAEGIDIGRPKLHNKLAHRRAQLGDAAVAAVGSATREEIEQLEHLRVAAAERTESLADRFALDLAAHVTTEAAAVTTAAEGEALEADIVASDEAAEEGEAEAEADAETEAAGAAEADSGLSIETLQELEFSKSTVYAPRKNALKSGVKAGTLKAGDIKWSNCQVAGKQAKGKAKGKKAKAAGAQSTLNSVVLRAAPPIRDQSLVVEIDGKYTGPDVTYGSATLQIARVSSTEPQAKDLPDLVYRHSIVLKDVLMANPFTARDPLSITMYVPESVFNMYAPSGEYTMSVVLTNQDKQPFACTKIDFALA